MISCTKRRFHDDFFNLIKKLKFLEEIIEISFIHQTRRQYSVHIDAILHNTVFQKTLWNACRRNKCECDNKHQFLAGK